MATAYAEHNQVKWTGTRPGIVGNQIIEYGMGDAAIDYIYTVPANKILLIFHTELYCEYSGGSAQGSFNLYDDTPALWKTIHISFSISAAQVTNVVSDRYIPIELPAGYHVGLVGTANVDAYGHVEGILIDA